ncbi:MAG: hypothetical protein FIB01_04735, partial [Gemmatimonadetes bacterium]|nr:hypothetical protein [Gemmatimonadota bacterium]
MSAARTSSLIAILRLQLVVIGRWFIEIQWLVGSLRDRLALELLVRHAFAAASHGLLRLGFLGHHPGHVDDGVLLVQLPRAHALRGPANGAELV